jgi:hypothetical protein
MIPSRFGVGWLADGRMGKGVIVLVASELSINETRLTGQDMVLHFGDFESMHCFFHRCG